MKRRLAAILAADVVGYSRLVEADEEGTLAALRLLRTQTIEPLIVHHHGRVVKLMGDGFLVEFASALDAVKCAIGWQEGITGQDEPFPLQFRIGINLGDIVIDGDDILGDGVNIAARLEGLAEPGGVVISDVVHQSVHGKLNLVFESGGVHALKNIETPVTIWTWVGNVPKAGHQTPSLSLPDKPSIAVLPFTNLSGDADQEYFSDGITEDIITELCRFRNLFVIARHSSFTYKDRSIKVQEVGRDLGVEFVVEGSVRKAGSRIRVTAQLVEASTGNHLWAERYDRDLEDIFAVQDELTESIVSCLPGRMEDAGTSQAKRKRTASMTAYDHLLLGLEQFRRFAREQNAKAREYFEKAIEIDPLFARAHALLASTYVWDIMAEFGDEHWDEAYQSIQTALSLDHEDAWSHAILGFLLFLQREDEDAEAEFQRAVTLNANDADVAAFRANVLVYLGQWRDALGSISRALRLNPHPPRWYHWYHALALFSGHKYEEALGAIRRIGPHFTPAHAYAAACHAHINQIEDARSEMSIFANAIETFPKSHAQCQQRTASRVAAERAARYRVPEDSAHFLTGLRKAGFSV